ncbi:hypothetical protein EDC04DRAFT_1692109 [Pisolithus marmoratus]|nr:hypothetical protein EDC04DRAFT_1692109 [Pisolithus marmoratus]
MMKQADAPSLPVFASDVVPIPSSSPKARPAFLPSTPSRQRLTDARHGPGKVDSDKKGRPSSSPNGSGPLRTPLAAATLSTPGTGAGSLFSPSASLFTPSTPTSTTRYMFTPKSPSAHRCSVPYTPRRNLRRTPMQRCLQTLMRRGSRTLMRFLVTYLRLYRRLPHTDTDTDSEILGTLGGDMVLDSAALASNLPGADLSEFWESLGALLRASEELPDPQGTTDQEQGMGDMYDNTNA